MEKDSQHASAGNIWLFVTTECEPPSKPVAAPLKLGRRPGERMAKKEEGVQLSKTRGTELMGEKRRERRME